MPIVECVNLSTQILMNVKLVSITVTLTQTALITRAVLSVPAILDILELEPVEHV